MIRMLLSAAIALAVGFGVAFAQDGGAAEMETATEAQPAAEAHAAIEVQPAAEVTLASLAVCRDIEERTPVGEADSFPSSVGKLWCFTWVSGATPPMQIYHRWFVGEELVNEIPITVRGRRWRCWSNKTIRPGWDGPCRVEVVTEEGDILGTREFTLVSE